jgi:peptidyl-prolyl cis-trans isomerase C
LWRHALILGVLIALLSATPGARTVNAQGATATPAEPLAALINNQIPITLAKLNATVTRQLEARKAVGDAMPSDLAAFQNSVLDSLIEQALIEEAARIQGIIVTDQDVETEIQSYIKAAGSKEKLLALVAADRMTEAEWRVGIRQALLTNKMRDIVTRGIGNTAEMVHARHILVADLNAATTILAQIRNGADFGTLASQVSLDQTTKLNGGDLGWFPRGQLLQKTVEDAAFALQVNEVSPPVRSELGFHLIQVIERAKDRPLDPATRARLQESTFEAWLQTLVKQATIVKFPRN